ncbi:MAG: VUT family protein [Lachnospiraceae bacterium]|nr:VUT family protein [Lachnospiraceae bacterium]
MPTKIKHEIRELNVLLRSIPSPIVILFAISVITMNLLANKSVALPVDWLALDCGIIISWVSFLSMDIITKYFGPKAATEVSVFVVLINLAVCLFFFLAGAIPGMWGEAYVDGSESLINGALDHTISGTWYVLFGSTVAFLTSAAVNNFLNYAIGKAIPSNPDGFGTYAVRSYISTAVGQFCDNLVFALIVSHFFFGWTLLQCVACSFTGMMVELFCEAVFSPIGFAVCQKWKRETVGREYFELKKNKDEGK